MPRYPLLHVVAIGLVATVLTIPVGCRSNQTAQIKSPMEADMVGSHTAGASVYKPLVQEAVTKLLARQSFQVQPAGYMDPSQFQTKRICFVGVENASIEELGDFKEQLYEDIDTQIVQSDMFQPISRRFVDAGLKEARIQPNQLFIPAHQERFLAVMQQSGQPFDYLLFAKLTSGTTQSNKDYQRDYLLTLDLVNLQTGQADKQSATISKGYNSSIKAKVSSWNPFD